MDLEKPEDGVFVAEFLQRRRKRKGRIEYLVKWQGYSPRHSTWEPEENILGYRLVDDFEERLHNDSSLDMCRPSMKKRRKTQEFDENRNDVFLTSHHFNPHLPITIQFQPIKDDLDQDLGNDFGNDPDVDSHSVTTTSNAKQFNRDETRDITTHGHFLSVSDLGKNNFDRYAQILKAAEENTKSQPNNNTKSGEIVKESKTIESGARVPGRVPARVLVTDITCKEVTVTFMESPTEKGFFKEFH